jgi:ribosomal protein S28E/S33
MILKKNFLPLHSKETTIKKKKHNMKKEVSIKTSMKKIVRIKTNMKKETQIESMSLKMMELLTKRIIIRNKSGRVQMTDIATIDE